MDYFRNTYRYVWTRTEELSNLPLYQNAAQAKTISFQTPILICQGCLTAGSGFSNLFEVNIEIIVKRTETKKVSFGENTGMYRYEDVPNSTVEVEYFQSSPSAIANADNEVWYASNGLAYLRRITADSRDWSGYQPKGWGDFYRTGNPIARYIPSGQVGAFKERIEFTIPALTPVELSAGKGYKYEIECVLDQHQQYEGAMLSSLTATFEGWHRRDSEVDNYAFNILEYPEKVSNPSSIKITTNFFQQDFDVATGGGYFIAKGEKYNCYQLLRKALLTCDTHIIDNSTTSLDEYNNLGQSQPSLKHSILLDEYNWGDRLRNAKVYETIFENKNLWEILLQIGYYIHAVPYLEFAEDGTDRFILRFRKLGETDDGENNSTKITIFNSRNLSDFFTQYDSYTTNLFSPQNLIDEWVTVKTSDPTCLVSNNTAEIHLAYPILQIEKFDISIKLNSGEWSTKSALEYVFEKSIYDILSNENPFKVFPCKGSSLYYELASNKILGLNFVPPAANNGDFHMALKRILQILWQGEAIPFVNEMKFNDLKFHVQYRTQDYIRLTQFRPDLQSFMKNSSYEKYPHHEQFYGQQEKIVDSERLSANLYGKLIRVGNNIYQKQEYCPLGNEKESGDLVMIDNEAYYVTECENEYYGDAIFQKVTYSKNFNQLSNIVTIPSEPRFYEVSERSKIRREVRLLDFLTLSTQKPPLVPSFPRFLNRNTWQVFIQNIIFNKSKPKLPNYAFTRFKVDKLRENFDSNGIKIPHNNMFPSSLIVGAGTNEIYPAAPSDHADCIVPLLHFPLHNGIVFEWDMADNFKAGDFTDDTVYNANETNDSAYLAKQALRYVDVKGRADLFSFKLFNLESLNEDTDSAFKLAQRLPQAFEVSNNDSIALVENSIALEKDCREELSFNYQINLLHGVNQNGADAFITFPNLFGEKESDLRMCFLANEVGMFDENINLRTVPTIEDNVEYDLISNLRTSIEIRITPKETTNLEEVKAIALYEESALENKTAYVIKNVGSLNNEQKMQSWWIYPVFSD